MKPSWQVAITTMCALLWASFIQRCDATATNDPSSLVVTAVVEKVGRYTETSSGIYTIYQLVKYRIVAVCAGSYDKKEIVVDHLLVSGDEVKGLKAGDKVYLTLQPSKSIAMRFDEEGLRSASENIETFYIARKLEVVESEQCK